MCSGWWAKIELFRPDITDDLFYLDLDTVIAGDIRPILEDPPTSFTMLRDFYHPQYRGSGALWIPNSVKAHIWSAFWQDPEGWIARKRKLTAVCSHQTRIGNLDAHLI